MKSKINLIFTGIFLIAFILLFSAIVFAQGVNYCCEKTSYGAWCQEDSQEECDSAYRNAPTSCESTSFCKLGCCYDSSEGTCMESTPQKVCQDSKGTWTESKECEIPQCNLGCCVLGTQASFVTLTRCKKLSSLYGLTTDFRTAIGSELECISLASLSDEGACVLEIDYERTCTFTSRQGCKSMQEGSQLKNGTITGNITFYKNLLCSDEELGTNCGPTEQTTCVEGKDEVYFVDSCGNTANVYDSEKVKDKSYWKEKIPKSESCGVGSANTNSRDCGNCNYFDGSICKDYKKISSRRPTYGNFICSDLNCDASETSDKKPHKHGESWCSTDAYPDAPGSRYFRHLCMNGDEIIEPCADFRQEICIQDAIQTAKGDFSQAACRVNRWQDCYSQGSSKDCINTDKRDCKWAGDKCVPEHPPGFKFWDEGETEGICSQANAQCIVDFLKEGYFEFLGGDKEPQCEKNCNCLQDSWQGAQIGKCNAIGDCGVKVNFIGQGGSGAGYSKNIEGVKDTGDED
ncbi:MAG: hypothetical protein KJ559_01395 [Nanoarchaeota archaeon]|nr:hypothetical protein [Nanoarchaeota archaeon]